MPRQSKKPAGEGSRSPNETRPTQARLTAEDLAILAELARLWAPPGGPPLTKAHVLRACLRQAHAREKSRKKSPRELDV